MSATTVGRVGWGLITALITGMLPKAIAEQLKREEKVEAVTFECVTIYFRLAHAYMYMYMYTIYNCLLS